MGPYLSHPSLIDACETQVAQEINQPRNRSLVRRQKDETNLEKSLRIGLTEADNSGYHVDPPARKVAVTIVTVAWIVRSDRSRAILKVCQNKGWVKVD